MLGFFIGTVCLLGLVKVLRGGPRLRVWRGFGPRQMLRRVFERLDTSPGQEKVLVAAASEIHAAMAPLREEMVATRRELAAALRAPSVDEVMLGDLFARHDEVLGEARKRAVGVLAQVHDALDEGQRARLADLVDRGRRSLRPGRTGPYRGVAL